MRPAGNENKGAMKLRVDFKQKHTGDFTTYGMLMFTRENKLTVSVNELDKMEVRKD